MQDSYQLPDNQEYPQSSSAINNQPQTTNNPLSMMMTSIISPKNNRRLAHSYNTASQQSLAYSNSTYHNKLTQRSPPLFNLDFLSNNNNDQNVNTMNYCYNGHGNKNQLISTFGTYGQGSRKGMAIKFDRITEESGIESQGGGNSFFNSNNANNKSTTSGMMINDMSLIGEGQQLIELPCFLSLENSPQNMKMASNYNNNDSNKSYSKELEQMEIVDMREVLQKDSLTIPMKMRNYKKITPSSSITTRMDKKNEQNEEDFEERQLTTTRRGNSDLQSVENNKNPFQNNQRRKLQQKKFNKNSNYHDIRAKAINLSSSSVSSLSKSPSPSKNTNNSNSNKKKATNNNNKNNKTLTINDNNNNRSQSEQQFIFQKQRIRQLQYELRTCEIQRQGLRTRVGILNELLQEKFLQNNSLFPFRLFNIRDSSKLIQHNNYEYKQKQQKSASSSYGSNNNKNKNNNSNNNNKSLYQQQQQSQNQHQPILMSKQTIHKNIDLLVEMTMIKREYEELKTQNELLREELDNFITNKGNQPSIVGDNKKRLQQKSIQVNKINSKQSPYQQQQHYQQQLCQLKQQLFQLKQQIQLYQQQKTQTQQAISLLQQKQTRFQHVQRPKLFQQIKQLMEKVNQQKDMIEKLQMENNLIALMKSIGSGLGNESPQRKMKESVVMLTSNGKQSVMGSPNSYGMLSCNKENSLPQQKFSIPQKIDLLALQKDHQLLTLKKQRDYFHSQYISLKSLQQTNYRLRLKIQDLQNQLSSIKQLIEVDDQITF